MDKLAGVIDFGTLEKLHYGAGSIAAVPEEMAARGLSRALIATGRTLGKSSHLDRLITILGEKFAGVFDRITEHAQAASIRDLVAEVERTGADTLISLGGGSAADSVKIAIACVAAGEDLTRKATTRFYVATPFGNDGRRVVNFAIPTTLSAGEYSFGAATTDDQGAKGAIVDHRIGPIAVFHDPEIAIDTPDFLWVSSGIKCLDHAIETLYSAHGDSFNDALAAKALSLLLENLPKSASDDPQVRMDARVLCQTAALLSNYTAANARYGLSHAVGHKIGSKFHVPHGVTSCLALAPSMRFMADVAPERFSAIAEVLHIPPGDASTRAHASADAIERFISGLGMPTQMRTLDIDQARLDEVLPPLLEQVRQAGTIGRDVTEDEMRTLVKNCW